MRAIGGLTPLTIALALAGGLVAAPAGASPFFFSTGNPDGLLAALSRPGSPGVIETETADDFVLTSTTSITSATFTGLVTGTVAPGHVGNVGVEIYRVFPLDSDVGRTSGPPTFGTPQVPTRVNSPSDVELTDRDALSGDMTFSTSLLNPSFTAGNSVVNGIHPLPGVFTGGDGPATGQEQGFDVTFTTPILLGPGHYFFVPVVAVSGGDFLWLSAPRPIVPPGTPFPVGNTDLQAWIRNANLDPDWLRIGTDITHQGPFNMTFSLSGDTVPEPGVWSMMILGLGAAGAALRRRRRPLTV
jgi:hypothetical protein